MVISREAYSAKKGRKFAFTISAALVLFAFIGWWRGRSSLPLALVAIAALLIVWAMIAPTKLEALDRGWMALSHAISRVTTPIFMGIVYFVVLSPIGAIRRMAGANPIDRAAVKDSYWISREQSDRSAQRKRMERQF
jgi:MFS superfamily sulfate permease-like transporter